MPKETKEIILSLLQKDLLPHDAAALFWYVRSSFYFHLSLNKNDRVLLFKYEDFVQNSNKYFNKLYQHIGFKLPKEIEKIPLMLDPLKKELLLN